MRATERNRERRYGSPRELGEDIRRFLGNRPIEAGPPSALYRVRKFVRRHRAGVTIAAVVLAVLMVGIAGTSWGLLKAIAARAETQSKAAELQTVMEFQQSMLAEIDLEKMGIGIREALQDEIDESGTAEAASAFDEAIAQANMTNVALEVIDINVLDRAVGTIDEQFDDQPTVEAALRQTIGDTYRDLGLYPPALTQMERALELRRREEAEVYFREALEGRRRVLGPDDPETITSINNVGFVLKQMGKLEEAEPFLREALEGRRRVLGDDHPRTLQSYRAVGNLLRRMGRVEEAQSPFKGPSMEAGASTVTTIRIRRGRSATWASCYRQWADPRKPSATISRRSRSHVGLFQKATS